jgi:hypothetical protein
MSTFYASFGSLDRAKGAVHELVSGGVDPDDLSLVSCKHGDANGEMRELVSSVGDATVFVGRNDDPIRDFPVSRRADITELTSIEMSRLSPIDTSNKDTDVDSFDQMEDSQNEYELQIHTHDGISQGTHEGDEIALSLITGFPTPVPTLDDVKPGDLARQEQFDDRIETIEIPGFGVVVGGGLLATAALDFVRQDGSCDADGLVAQLKDEGVPEDVAKNLQSAFQKGDSILAVLVTPGAINEDAVEEIAERNGGLNFGLFDAPRY